MKIVVTPEEFEDIIIGFLYDALVHDDSVRKSESFEEFLEWMRRSGAKPKLMSAYLGFEQQQRMKYKKIRQSFYSADHDSNILIREGDYEKAVTNKEGVLKRLLKSVFGEARAYKIRYGRPITEDHLDHFLDKALKKYKDELYEINSTEDNENGGQ